MKKRLVAVLTAVVLLLGLVPGPVAVAAGDGTFHDITDPTVAEAAELLRQLGQPLGRQTAGCHLLRGFGQAVGLVDDQRLVVPQQWLPAVLAVEGIGQQIVMVADLDRDRWPVGFAQVLLVAAAFPLGAAAVTVRWHADVPAVIAGQPRHMVKVQAAAGFAQQRSLVGKLLATLGDLQPPLLQAQVTGEPFFALAQYSAYGCVNISVLY